MKVMALRFVPEWLANLAAALLIMAMLAGMSGCTAVVMAPAPAAPVIADMQVLTVHGTTVARGISRVLAGMPGGSIFQNGSNINQYMFVWANENQKTIMFWGVDMKEVKVLDVVTFLKSGGGVMNSKTGLEVIDWLKTNGWIGIGPAEVPAALKIAIELITAGSTITMPLLVFPGGMYNGIEDLIPREQS